MQNDKNVLVMTPKVYPRNFDKQNFKPRILAGYFIIWIYYMNRLLRV